MRQAGNGNSDQGGRSNTPSRRLSQMAEYSARPDSPGVYGNYIYQQDQEAQDDGKSKLNRLVQNFFTKAAMAVIHTRMKLPPSLTTGKNGSTSGLRRVNKWFGLELDETDMFSTELQLWRTLNAYDPQQSPPPPLVIETILDASELTPDQTLVVIFPDGRRVKVESGSSRDGRSHGVPPEVVLERWRVVLGPSSTGEVFTEELPVVYKKIIPVFRTVYSYTLNLPTARFIKKQLGKQPRLKIRCRIRNGDRMSSDELNAVRIPLAEKNSEPVTQSYNFGTVDCPVGSLSVDVTYRLNCDFRVEDSESLLSSDFMNQDEYFFQPSLETRSSNRAGQLAYAAGREPSSAPTGTMSRPGSSVTQPANGLPVTNLATGERRIQHIRNAPSVSGSPIDQTSSIYRSARDSNPSLRSVDNAARRSSVSFNPFKSPSVASSPGTGLTGSRVIPGSSLPQRSRPPSGTSGPLPQRVSIPPMDQASIGQPSSGSPRPSSMRFSSSFTNRPPRYSGASINKPDDDGASSGKGSVSSSTNAWTANFPDDSGHSITEDAEKLRELMQLLELTEKRGLKSFEHTTAVDPLSKFRSMRDTHAALTDSINHLNPSNSSQPQLHSPQRPVSYPAASGLNSSLSSSTSPQLFQISPHTPHAPVVRSRLSEGLSAADAGIAEGRGSFHQRPRTESPLQTASNATPLDIPSSPRHRAISSFRRPSSFVQNRATAAAVEDLEDPATAFANAGRQSASLGTVDTLPVSLSGMREGAVNSPTDQVQDENISNPAATSASSPSASPSIRGKLPLRGRGGWGGQNSGSVDDDDLLFTMSEYSGLASKMGQNSTKSNALLNAGSSTKIAEPTTWTKKGRN